MADTDNQNIPVGVEQIGKRINIIRVRERLSQAEWARRLGISQSLESAIERGARKVSPSLIKKISETYGYTQGWLLYGRGDMESPQRKDWESKEEFRKRSAIMKIEQILPELDSDKLGFIRNIIEMVALASNFSYDSEMAISEKEKTSRDSKLPNEKP